MTITYISSDDVLVAQSDEITNLIATIVSSPPYSSVKVTGTLTCGTEFTQEYTIAELAAPVVTNKWYLDLSNGLLVVNPLFFGLSTYTDGIYKLQITYFKVNNGGYFQEMNCIFVDITYRCKVATFLGDLVEETKDPSKEKIASNIMLLHYALTTSSNCNCNCTEMCDAFNQLTILLSGIDPQILTDCGC
jgi:hypothetical protein